MTQTPPSECFLAAPGIASSATWRTRKLSPMAEEWEEEALSNLDSISSLGRVLIRHLGAKLKLLFDPNVTSGDR